MTNTSSQTLNLGGPGSTYGGEVPLGITISSPNCPNYVQGNPTGVALAPGASCTFEFTLGARSNSPTTVTVSQTSPASNPEGGLAPVFGGSTDGGNTWTSFYVPFTATIGPAGGNTGGGGGTGGFPAGVQAAQGCTPLAAPVSGMAATHDDGGYWVVDQAGQIDARGDATTAYGELASAPASPIVAVVATADAQGYWLVGQSGAIYAFGDAGYYGALAALPAAEQPGVPVVGMAADAAGTGYWEVTTGGDIYSFGTAQFHGSTDSIALNRPVVGMALDPATGGYWLDASGGGIFCFGSSGFFGSAA